MNLKDFFKTPLYYLQMHTRTSATLLLIKQIHTEILWIELI